MKYLITGITGSGKTSIASKLRQRGYAAYDGDKRSSLGQWVDHSGRPVKVPNRLTKDWIAVHSWDWSKDQLIKLLNQHQMVFVCGTSSNQHELYDLFDKIFLLQVSRQEMLKRLNSRPWGFGKFKQEQKVVLEWHEGYDEFHLQFGLIPINANRPLAAVADDILNRIDEPKPSP